MFELEQSSAFFEELSGAHPEIVQNIEIVHENKLLLDVSYHKPKLFILHLNNLLRSLLFFFELSTKNSPHWLRTAANEFRESKRDEYEILKYLRDRSVHQRLILPDESLIVGLFRIQSDVEYRLKVGFGDHNSPGKYADDFALRNTEDIFHDILVFPSIAFMDLEHVSLGECLGITRKWFIQVNFKNRTTKFNQIVNVYDLVATFSAGLLNSICDAYASIGKVQNDAVFHYQFAEHNFINTILELDLYPSLFEEWWGGKTDALNFGILASRQEGDGYWKIDSFHKKTYQRLCASPQAYKKLLEKYHLLPLQECFLDENIDEFASFIRLNHWHYKKAFNASLMKGPFSASEIMLLQRLGRMAVEDYKNHHNGYTSAVCERFRHHLSELAQKISSD